jgi:hypothetical protein
MAAFIWTAGEPRRAPAAACSTATFFQPQNQATNGWTGARVTQFSDCTPQPVEWVGGCQQQAVVFGASTLEYFTS